MKLSQLRKGSEAVRWERPGQQVTGTLVRIEAAENTEGLECPRLILDTADGQVALTAYQVNLRDQLIDLALVHGDPAPGDRYRITYQGDKALGGGRSMKVFEVHYKRTEAPAPAVIELTDEEAF